MSKYSVGVDFGTLSARAVLVNLENGKEVETAVFAYPDGVIEKSFKGKKLDNSYAFQNPRDYILALCETVKGVLKKSGISLDDVAGLGIDFTSCTVLPVKKDGTPLCFCEKYENEIMSYAKLWKHHGGEREAELMTKIAKETNPSLLKRYGGKVSSEWLFPKILETLNKNPEIYEEADCFTEAGDWLMRQITGEKASSLCMAGYKAMYDKKDGFPDGDYFERADKRLKNIIGTKVCDRVLSVGEKLGEINERGAEITGLNAGTAVAVPIIDAHSALLACGVVTEGRLMLIMGTSSCHIVLAKEKKEIEGLCGVVEDGIVPGYFAYEAGQTCVGDSFEWFMENCVPKKYYDEAKKQNMNIYDFMEKKAGECDNFQSGLVCLDWFNGNRTPYVDFTLTSAISGLTLKTKTEELYRAIIEGTAFGTRAILDLYEKNGIEIKEITAAGGIAEKSGLIMQIYADVTGRKIKLSGSPQAGALGSAVLGAVAGGYFKNINDAVSVMAKIKDRVYVPSKENTEKYNLLYKKYCRLADNTRKNSK